MALLPIRVELALLIVSLVLGFSLDMSFGHHQGYHHFGDGHGHDLGHHYVGAIELSSFDDKEQKVLTTIKSSSESFYFKMATTTL